MQFGPQTVLSGLNLDVMRGETLVVMGGSGCGKSTLLKHMLGLIEPTAGEILYSGENFTRAGAQQRDAIRRRWGITYQTGGMFSAMTLAENVALPLQLYSEYSPDEIADIVAYKLALVGLAGFQGFYPAEISGGMLKRAALARAIALDPELIMYDEPFAGLDPISLGVAANLIRKLNDATGATSLVVSHDVQECFLISDYAYVISSGRIVGHGTPAEIKASEHPEVRQFILGEPDGPVRFHYPARAYAQDLELSA